VEVSGQVHVTAALLLGKNLRCAVNRRSGRLQCQSARLVRETDNFTLPKNEIGSLALRAAACPLHRLLSLSCAETSPLDYSAVIKRLCAIYHIQSVPIVLAHCTPMCALFCTVYAILNCAFK
jgi:hypothetical protein